MNKFCAALVGAMLLPSEAVASEFSVEGEKRVQLTAMATGYAFSAIHTALIVSASTRGEALHRNWAAGTILSAISVAGMHSGLLILASETDEQAWRARYQATSVSGMMLGGAQLGFAIDSLQRGDGDAWMDPGPASLSLFQGTAMAVLGGVLIAFANSGTSDLSKVPPIYTWTASGTILSGYSILSLIHAE